MKNISLGAYFRDFTVFRVAVVTHDHFEPSENEHAHMRIVPVIIHRQFLELLTPNIDMIETDRKLLRLAVWILISAFYLLLALLTACLIFSTTFHKNDHEYYYIRTMLQQKQLKT